MAIRHGTVLIFAEGIDPEVAERALLRLVEDGVLSNDHFLEYPKGPDGRTDHSAEPKKVYFRIEEFNDDFSGPVWYVP
jgi:hypothetical protein